MSARDRLPIGQLLGRSLRIFREDLFRAGQLAGYHDLRESHLQVFGVIDRDGTRLTELASRANMTSPSMAELVDQLEELGYVERTPDTTDGRAKLIRLTLQGRRLVRETLRVVDNLETKYRQVVGAEEFEAACRVLQDLIDSRNGPSKLSSWKGGSQAR